jgi:hypothetical protein
VVFLVTYFRIKIYNNKHVEISSKYSSEFKDVSLPESFKCVLLIKASRDLELRPVPTTV